MMINIVFDLDDTLYSLYPVFTQALDDLFEDLEIDRKSFYTIYREEASKLFTASQTGEISMDEYHLLRTKNAFRRIGIELEDSQAMDFHNLYTAYKDKISLSDETIGIIEHLKSKNIPLGIITNGSNPKQSNTIKSLQIAHHFNPDNIIISGEIGIDKPDRRIFDLWQENIDNDYPSVYIGDSIPHDIVGAHNADWFPIWFNPFNKPVPQLDFAFTVINSLQDILEIPFIKNYL